MFLTFLFLNIGTISNRNNPMATADVQKDHNITAINVP